MATVDAEAEPILEYMRRCYMPSDGELEEDYAGMTRGERAEEMERRKRRCETLVSAFSRRCYNPKEEELAGLSGAEREAEKERRRKAGAAMMRESSRIIRSATVKADVFSGMGEEERTVEAARRRRNALEKARRIQDPVAALRARLTALALDFDPKQWGEYYNRPLYFIDVDTFELNEESPLGPTRFSQIKSGNKPELCDAVNILSVNIASSDVGFPIHVYGAVIARDSIDEKCLYLFRRTKDNCQVIKSEAESLILTGPKRGLMLLDNNFVEIDLKIKDHQGQEKELSKGYLTIDGVVRRPEECTVERESLATRLSTVDVTYAYMEGAVEATIAIERVQGDFFGEITAHTSSIRNNIVLHDSKLDGVLTGEGEGAIQLLRPVVAVPLKDMLYIVVRAGDGKPECIIRFTPRAYGGEEDEIFVGGMKMRIKVTWSMMDF